MNQTSDPNTSELCQPIKQIDAVLNWEKPIDPNWSKNVIKRSKRSSQCFKGLNHCKLNTESIKIPSNLVPKTLYCHDMAGGYLNDKYVYGSNDNEGFEFFRWTCLDIFVYFSHHLVTIPPLGWINAAHKNGVKVLGTIITEGTLGEQLWFKVLNNDDNVIKFATALVGICEYYGFEGYLLNVENNIPPNKLNVLNDFINILRTELKSIDSENLLIWYDSVIQPLGVVYYQNALNVLNRPFFDLTDGIFLNYGWSDTNLETSVANAAERKLDVFVGVDVFGRGCRGGGGFGTVEAVKVIRSYGLSVALFAPGWVHECCLPGEKFLARDYKFWNYLCEHLYVYGPSYLPFKTTFCLGRGKKLFVNGKLEKEGPWYDLTKQDYQISGLMGSHGFVDTCLSYYDEDSFNGGGCLLVKHPPKCTNNQHVDRLFICDFPTKEGNKIVIKVTYKPLLLNSNPQLYITVLLEANGVSRNILLKDKHPPAGKTAHDKHINFWATLHYELEPTNGRIYEIGCFLNGDKSPLLLGEINIAVT